MTKKIDPTVLKGTRDIPPGEMVARNKIMDMLRKAFEQYGYQPLQTPILSKAETILGKEQSSQDETQKLAYSFKDFGDRDVALPFDLTMPFARFVSANSQELAMPFKRYQMQRVWRAENTQKGRMREFYQCDIDIVGSKNLICEAEIAKIIDDVFARLNLKDITIRINSRKLLNKVLSSFKTEATSITEAIRIIDKLDKKGSDKVAGQLNELGIDKAEEILSLLRPGKTNEQTLSKLAPYDLGEINEFLELCEKFNVDMDKIMVDPSLARGLDYYTGIIFEVVAGNKTDVGSICAGGRYDDLCGLFSKQDISGVGVSFGFERIMILLDELKLVDAPRSTTQVLVTVFDEQSRDNAIKIYNELLKSRLRAEIYLDQPKLAKQLKFADKKSIPFVVIQGPDEAKRNQVIIKRMSNGKEKSLPKEQLSSYIRGFYES